MKSFNDFYKDSSHKDGLYPSCKACKSDKNNAYKRDNKQKVLAEVRQWKEQNKDKVKTMNSEWYLANKELVSVKHRSYYSRNKTAILNQTKEYEKANPAKINAKIAKRRAAKLQATPLWLTKEHLKSIELYYLVAKWIEFILDEKIEVDHVVPLQGKNISGLHVPWNIQLLTKTVNRQKGNNYE
jgi:5-methylcytosine-specific restriction endonuclease McrA